MFGMFRGGLKSFALLAGAALFVVLLFHDAIARHSAMTLFFSRAVG